MVGGAHGVTRDRRRGEEIARPDGPVFGGTLHVDAAGHGNLRLAIERSVLTEPDAGVHAASARYDARDLPVIRGARGAQASGPRFVDHEDRARLGRLAVLSPARVEPLDEIRAADDLQVAHLRGTVGEERGAAARGVLEVAAIERDVARRAFDPVAIARLAENARAVPEEDAAASGAPHRRGGRERAEALGLAAARRVALPDAHLRARSGRCSPADTAHEPVVVAPRVVEPDAVDRVILYDERRVARGVVLEPAGVRVRRARVDDETAIGVRLARLADRDVATQVVDAGRAVDPLARARPPALRERGPLRIRYRLELLPGREKDVALALRIRPDLEPARPAVEDGAAIALRR